MKKPSHLKKMTKNLLHLQQTDLKITVKRYLEKKSVLSNQCVYLFQCVSEKIQKLNPYLFASAITGNAESKNSVSDPIPDPPPIPESPVLSETITELVNEFNALGEPTFASLGLGGWTPVGIVQTCMEYLHVTLGIPWWQAIVIGNIYS